MGKDSLHREKNQLARLVIADDHELVRTGLRAMLTGQRGLEVVGEATNGREALMLCRHLRPDLALVDVRMPEQDGLSVCRTIKQECPATSVILVTIYESVGDLLRAIKDGAAGYVLKDISQQELITAVRSVLRGESLLDHELVTRTLQRLASQTPGHKKRACEQLSLREREVLHLLAQGQTNREISGHLMLSVSTVKIHVEHILSKLGVSDRTQAAVRATELGLIQGDRQH
jgi:DNA-binding NarL/FixJ family response regulator